MMDACRLHLCRDLDIHVYWVRKGTDAPIHHVDHTSPPEMVEPLEETRSELIFATEPLLSSLYLSIPNSHHRSPIVELDEVEVPIISSPGDQA